MPFWGSNCSNSTVLRIFSFADFDSHSNPLFTEMEILKIWELFKIHQLKLAFEFYRGLIHMDLCSLFKKSEDVHTTNLNLNSNRKNCLFLPSVKTVNYGSRSLRYQCASIWNYFMTSKIRLDDKSILDMSKVHNIHQFKRLLKKHYSFMYTID